LQKILEVNKAYIQNVGKHDRAYTRESSKQAEKENASPSHIFVTTTLDYFGPILPEHDHRRKTGMRVGETWDNRLECRQWGAHLPHIGGVSRPIRKL
jgi:E3 ubiquitin-protein ligase UHRF1